MELEVRHLTALIDNETLVRNSRTKNFKQIGIINGVYPLYDKNKNIFWQYTTNNNSIGNSINECQPILRPLTDLIKPLPITCEIPIIECAKMACLDSKILDCSKPNLMIDSETAICEYDFNNENYSGKWGFEIDIDDDFGMDVYHIKFYYQQIDQFPTSISIPKEITEFYPIPNMLKILKYLRSKSFDIDGLIKADLALDINSVPLQTNSELKAEKKLCV